MSRSRYTVKHRNVKRRPVASRKHRLMPKDVLNVNGLPRATVLAQFHMTDENIRQFERAIPHPSDCAINALQLLDVISSREANFMRATLSQDSLGLYVDQIAKICTFAFRQKYVFSSVPAGFEDFASRIKTQLKKEHACFAGYKQGSASHVVVIGKHSDGRIVLIDPQQQTYCALEDTACLGQIARKERYYLLNKADGALTRAQMQTLGFVV